MLRSGGGQQRARDRANIPATGRCPPKGRRSAATSSGRIRSWTCGRWPTGRSTCSRGRSASERGGPGPRVADGRREARPFRSESVAALLPLDAEPPAKLGNGPQIFADFQRRKGSTHPPPRIAPQTLRHSATRHPHPSACRLPRAFAKRGCIIPAASLKQSQFFAASWINAWNPVKTGSSCAAVTRDDHPEESGGRGHGEPLAGRVTASLSRQYPRPRGGEDGWKTRGASGLTAGPGRPPKTRSQNTCPILHSFRLARAVRVARPKFFRQKRKMRVPEGIPALPALFLTRALAGSRMARLGRGGGPDFLSPTAVRKSPSPLMHSRFRAA